MSQKEYFARLRIFSAAGENRGISLKTGIGSTQGTSAGQTLHPVTTKVSTTLTSDKNYFI